MKNFISGLIEYTSEAESPTNFWKWAAIGCLSSVLRDNVFLETPIGTIYPNIYVVLFSDSGIARKAAPCKFVGKLIQKVGNTKFIAGRASMQAVIKELGRSYTNEHGHIVSGASGIMYSEELSSFIVDDTAAIPLLIDLYDYHEKWASNLISWTGSLKNVCLSLLCASNSDLFSSVYTDKAIKGGLLGRTFIIKEDNPRHRKSLFDLKVQGENTFESLLKHLTELSKVTGLIKYDAEAYKEYNDWYYSIPDEIFKDRLGFGSRLGTHVLKVAISIAAARKGFDKWLVKDDILEAIDLCQNLRKTYKELSFGVGASSNSYQASILIKAIVSEKNYHITRKKLIQRTFGDLDSVEALDRLLILMVQGELISETSLNNEVGYKLAPRGLDLLIGGTNGNYT